MPKDLAGDSHWDDVWAATPRRRLPSALNVGVGDTMRLLAPHVGPDRSVLEIGCAPGKLLLWCASKGARVAGVDYSARGIKQTRELFDDLGVPIDLRHEDVFNTSFGDGSFDLVYSLGVIEHFDDPREIVRAHVRLAKPGGKVIIAIPNYGGWYGSVQRWMDAELLAIHNLQIMSASALKDLAPKDLSRSVEGYTFGRFSPWVWSWTSRFSARLSRIISWSLNGLGLLQPVVVAALSPTLVLEIERA
jgi:2-polyprenyl-3-methyl-5-hydroxy-6-metoxy-1,4-benzoquinol methylase